MEIFLDESAAKAGLVPFSYTRHVADIRIGILTIREKWQALLPAVKFAKNAEASKIIMDASVIPTIDNLEKLLNNPGTVGERRLQYSWQIAQWNDWAIREDFRILRNLKKKIAIPSSVQAIGPENIFIEDGAILSHCIINAFTGPVYIGKSAEIMEGITIRGPVAICEGALVKMGAKLYPGTTIGPYCVAGGEIKNSMLSSYSNKAHDGYLGDSVIGSWCNLGAGTSNSNVKNTGTTIKYTLPDHKEPVDAGQKAGLIMGDYSRAAINTAFNTGSYVGVCCNVFGDYFAPAMIPNFTWGKEKYLLEKAFRDIENWKIMKDKSLTQQEKDNLQQLYNHK